MASTPTQLPRMRLVYFDMPGRAEAIRLAFTIGDIPFEDDRVTYGQYEVLKAEGKLPLGQLPVLFVDEKPYVQSIAILRYVGKLAGLYPKDEVQALVVDQICDTVQDLYASAMPIYKEKDIHRRVQIGEDLMAKDFRRMLTFLDGISSANRDHGHYLTGPELTIADLAFATVARWLSSGSLPGVDPHILQRYPKLDACVHNVLSIKKVEDYMASTTSLESPIMSPVKP